MKQIDGTGCFQHDKETMAAVLLGRLACKICSAGGVEESLGSILGAQD